MKKRYLAILIVPLILLGSCAHKDRVVFDEGEIHTLVGANTAAWHVCMPEEVTSFIKEENCFIGMHFREENKYAVYRKDDSITWRKMLLINTEDSIFSEMSYYGRFYIHNLEKIHVTNPFFHPNSFLEVNILDSTSDAYKISWIDTNIYLQVLSNYSPPVFIKNKLYITIGSYESYKNLQSKYSKPSIVEVEFLKDSLIKSKIFGVYPKGYQECFYHQPEGSFLTTDGHYLYQSFSHNHSVYVYEGTNLARTVNTPSTHVAEFTPIDTSGRMSSRSYVSNYLNTTFAYKGLIYDPYRKLFYRILVFPEKMMYERDFAVMVFDKDLNFLSEQIFEGAKYEYGFFIIAKEGVYIECKLDIHSPHLYMQLFTPRIIDRKGEIEEDIKSFKRKVIRPKGESAW